MNIFIIRNNQRYGPYNDFALLTYVNSGQILLRDKAIASGDNVEHTVRYFLKKENLKYKIPLKVIFKNFNCWFKSNFPKVALFLKSLLRDKRHRLFLFIVLVVVIICVNGGLGLLVNILLLVILLIQVAIYLVFYLPVIIEEIKKANR